MVQKVEFVNVVLDRREVRRRSLDRKTLRRSLSQIR